MPLRIQQELVEVEELVLLVEYSAGLKAIQDYVEAKPESIMSADRQLQSLGDNRSLLLLALLNSDFDVADFLISKGVDVEKAKVQLSAYPDEQYLESKKYLRNATQDDSDD